MNSETPSVTGGSKLPAALQAKAGTSLPRYFYVLAIALYVLLVITFIQVRFTGQWIDADATNLTLLSQNVFQEARLIPRSGAYPFGYAYSALNTFLAHLTGLSITSIQNTLQPFLIMLLVAPAYAAFHALSEDRVVAGLATLLLFLQPDFLFETVRSSHAKLTWLLALTVLFLLSRSMADRSNRESLHRWVLLFYLATLGLLSSSIFFGSSYILAFIFAFLATQFLSRLPTTQTFSIPHNVRRLSYVTMVSFTLVFLMMFYLYSPSLSQLQQLTTIMDQISSLLLGVENIGANPYAYVGQAWNSTFTYLLLTSLNYVILLTSFLGWLEIGRRLIRGQQIQVSRFLLWLFYTSFAGLLAFSIVIDVAGVLSSNMQVRLFPHLMVIAIPLASLTLVDLLQALRSMPRAYQSTLLGLIFLVPLFSAFSVLKATNDPLVGNQWLFQTSQERQALEWAKGRVQNTTLWIGPDNRLRALVSAESTWAQNRVRVVYQPQDETRYYLLSDVIRARATRMGTSVPDVFSRHRVYDNGTSWFYYRRPLTPYQR